MEKKDAIQTLLTIKRIIEVVETNVFINQKHVMEHAKSITSCVDPGVKKIQLTTKKITELVVTGAFTNNILAMNHA